MGRLPVATTTTHHLSFYIFLKSFHLHRCQDQCGRAIERDLGDRSPRSSVPIVLFPLLRGNGKAAFKGGKSEKEEKS